MAVQSNPAAAARRAGMADRPNGYGHDHTLEEGGHVLTILLIIIVLLLLFGGGWGYSRRGRRI
jgi:hypothetical protein